MTYEESYMKCKTLVVSGTYDNTTKKVILTLQNGSTIEFSVAEEELEKEINKKVANLKFKDKE